MDLQEVINQLEIEEGSFNPQTLQFTTAISFCKGLSTEDLTELFKMALSRETLVNNQLLANINILVNGYNTLDDALFNSPTIIIKDVEQLLDLKLSLAEEIKAFQTKAVYWYLACLYSAHKVEYTYLDNIIPLPNVWRKFLTATNLLIISQMMAKANPIDTGSLPLVENAYPIIVELSANLSIASHILSCLKIND